MARRSEDCDDIENVEAPITIVSCPRDEPESVMGDIPAALALQRSQRPLGAAQCCVRCVYWQPYMFEQRCHLDDLDGECRRHAPRATPFLMTCMANTIGALAWAAEVQADIEHDKREVDYRFDTQDQHGACWPRTNSDHWCGEFIARKEPLKLMARRPGASEGEP